MLSEAFFNSIDAQLKSKLPFVVYRKPNDQTINAILQKNSEIKYCAEFNESGFVFAPYDSNKLPIIFPLDSSKLISTDELSFDVLTRPDVIHTTDESSKKAHVALVERGVKAIHNDKLDKVVLSRIETVSSQNNDPIDLLKHLLNSYQHAMVYLWYHPEIGLWLGATPETLLKVEGKRFQTMALAGTQRFQSETAIEWDEKNLNEQGVVTAYITETLASHSTQIQRGETQTIKAGNLLHLKTPISGILKQDALKGIIRSLHPTPAVCGIPTALAQQFILDNENYNREYYTGFLGELNFKVSKLRNTNRRNVEHNAYTAIKTTSDLYVNLRCMQLRNDTALVYVGGGITKDSNAELEWVETVNKAQTMLSVLN